jgi:hypothetical protein
MTNWVEVIDWHVGDYRGVEVLRSSVVVVEVL